MRLFIDALCYNLFAIPRYWLEENVAHFLQHRIDKFHTTNTYASFRNAYFDFFGMDGETATLLARYQTEKAKSAIGILSWTLLWAIMLVSAMVVLFRAKSKFDALQDLLAWGWLLLGFSYLMLAWWENDMPFLVSLGFV